MTGLASFIDVTTRIQQCRCVPLLDGLKSFLSLGLERVREPDKDRSIGREALVNLLRRKFSVARLRSHRRGVAAFHYQKIHRLY
jgi:hypothetical protein